MTLAARIKAPGWYRVAVALLVGAAFSFGLDVLIRSLQHQHPVIDGKAIATIAMIALPLAFILGIGCFD